MVRMLGKYSIKKSFIAVYPEATYRDIEKAKDFSKPKPVTSSTNLQIARLFVPDLSGDRIFSLNTDGSDRKVIVTGCRHPDGI